MIHIIISFAALIGGIYLGLRIGIYLSGKKLLQGGYKEAADYIDYDL